MKLINKKPMSERSEKERQRLQKLAEKHSSDDEQELWENKKLGNDPEYIKVSETQVSQDSKPIPTSIRLPKELIQALQKLAKEDGLPYQTYLKMVLTRHIKEKKAG